MPSGLFYIKSLDRFISNRWGARLIISLLWLVEMPLFNANSVDPDRTPGPVASDLFAKVGFKGRQAYLG